MATEYVLYGIAEALIFCDAEPQQLEFIRRFTLERWQKEQKEDVHRMVEKAGEYIPESELAKHDEILNFLWLKWVERYICNRFQYMLRWEWVEAFAMMDDETLLIRAKGEHEALYLKYVRDYARRYLDEERN